MTLDKETRWDKGRFGKTIHLSNEDKITIANYYQAALKTGRSSDEVLQELEVKYGKSTRQIQRYIRDIGAKRAEQAIHPEDRTKELEQMRHYLGEVPHGYNGDQPNGEQPSAVLLQEDKQHFRELQEMPGTAIDGLPVSIPVYRIDLEHWARIGRVAEELTSGLSLISLKDPAESRFGGELVYGDYSFDPNKTPALSFSAEKNKLWEYFLQHMSAEYESFREEFRQYKEIASRLIIENTDPETGWRDLKPVWTCQETEKLKEKLWLVVERGTFKGTCDICRGWKT